jgi:hypothetical protein
LIESLYYLLLAKDLNYIDDGEANELKAMLIAFTASVRNSVYQLIIHYLKLITQI